MLRPGGCFPPFLTLETLLLLTTHPEQPLALPSVGTKHVAPVIQLASSNLWNPGGLGATKPARHVVGLCGRQQQWSAATSQDSTGPLQVLVSLSPPTRTIHRTSQLTTQHTSQVMSARLYSNTAPLGPAVQIRAKKTRKHHDDNDYHLLVPAAHVSQSMSGGLELATHTIMQLTPRLSSAEIPRLSIVPPSAKPMIEGWGVAASETGSRGQCTE